MEDHGVGRLLRELPRETARPGFTQRVLARLDEPARSAAPAMGWRFRLAMATALLMVCLAGRAGVVRYEESREAARAAEAQRLLQEIRAEHDRLEQDLRALAEPPVIYVGGDERLDLVIDLVIGLDKVPAEDGPTPATYRVDTF
jgi:cytochrome c-type biogenesis protein CcmH/NrfG